MSFCSITPHCIASPSLEFKKLPKNITLTMASNSRNVFTQSEKQCLLELITKHNLHKSFTLGGTSLNTKRDSWLRLVEEFNSIETNGRRTENQLRKCWDNLKTRQKQLLAKEKKERMRTGGGPFEPVVVSPGENTITEDALFEQTDMELSNAIDSDTVPTQGFVYEDIITTIETSTENETVIHNTGNAATQATQIIDTAPHRPGSRHTDHSAGLTRGPRNSILQEEICIRQETYKEATKREEELHSLKKKEREWMMMAAEESYKKAKIERQSAEELLLYNQSKRKLIELQLLQMNHN